MTSSPDNLVGVVFGLLVFAIVAATSRGSGRLVAVFGGAALVLAVVVYESAGDESGRSDGVDETERSDSADETERSEDAATIGQWRK